MCSKLGITSFGLKTYRWDLIGPRVAPRFATRNVSLEFRWDFVEDFVAIAIISQTLNEISTKFQRFFLWQKGVASGHTQKFG